MWERTVVKRMVKLNVRAILICFYLFRDVVNSEFVQTNSETAAQKLISKVWQFVKICRLNFPQQQCSHMHDLQSVFDHYEDIVILIPCLPDLGSCDSFVFLRLKWNLKACVSQKSIKPNAWWCWMVSDSFWGLSRIPWNYQFELYQRLKCSLIYDTISRYSLCSFDEGTDDTKSWNTWHWRWFQDDSAGCRKNKPVTFSLRIIENGNTHFRLYTLSIIYIISQLINCSIIPDFSSFFRPEFLAKEVMKVIKYAENGTIWVVEGAEPAYEYVFSATPIKKKRVIPSS